MYKFITSLNPRNIERCRTCVDNWLLYLSEVVAVQTAEEIEQLQPSFPDITFVETTDLDEKFDTKCPKIRALIAQGPGILINSDIEIHTDRDKLLRNIVYQDDNILKCGVRYDYTDNISDPKKKLNRYGIDVFNITPKLMEILTSTEYTIGQPGWDYYFVLEANKHDIEIHTQAKPAMFYHKVHPINWARWKLTLAQSILEKRYNASQSDITRKVQRLTGRR